MPTYLLKEKCGDHTTEKGVLIKPGERFSTISNLHETSPDKFELVDEAKEAAAKVVATASEYGEDVTEAFADSLGDFDAKIFKKGRRYRIVVDETAINTNPSRLTNDAKVREALAAINLEDDEEEVEDADSVEE